MSVINQWVCQPEAEKIISTALEKACRKNPWIENLQQNLLQKTSTRLFDWLDHLICSYSPELEGKLQKVGFIFENASSSYRVFHHPGAQLPRIVISDRKEQEVLGIAIIVDSIADFLMVRGLSCFIEGTPFSGYRRCCVSTENGISLWVVERRGTWTMEPIYLGDEQIKNYWEGVELWKSRSRSLEEEEECLKRALSLAQSIVDLVGENFAAALVLKCEREYWQSKNLAGQIQKNRQDQLGMGWANHDHHTFRSSRKNFNLLVRLFEILGFQCRERFYAGEEAGWGAQVMENSAARLVLFLDVDLDPHELKIDFAHQLLEELPALGTVGLWCALHGDSIVKAGMHHLEAQFMFEDLRKDLAEQGIGMMDPFSNFPFLKQAFTKGEMWVVDSQRIRKLRETGKITLEQENKFLEHGAVGSHLENLQRREGFKGFNQKNISTIIKKTDPRTI